MIIEAMKQALDALEFAKAHGEFEQGSGVLHEINNSSTTLRQAIEQAEKQETVLKPCWYESKEKTMCRKCGQVHAEAILPNQEKQEQCEPVAWMFQHEDTGLTDFVDVQQVEWGFENNNPRWKKICSIYTHPSKREWVGLTDEEIYDYADKFLYQHGSNYGIKSFGKAIEAKLKQKNGYAEEKNNG